MKYGRLRVRTIALGLTNHPRLGPVTVAVNGMPVDASLKAGAGKVLVTLAAEAVIQANEMIEVSGMQA